MKTTREPTRTRPTPTPRATTTRRFPLTTPQDPANPRAFGSCTTPAPSSPTASRPACANPKANEAPARTRPDQPPRGGDLQPATSADLNLAVDRGRRPRVERRDALLGSTCDSLTRRAAELDLHRSPSCAADPSRRWRAVPAGTAGDALAPWVAERLGGGRGRRGRPAGCRRGRRPGCGDRRAPRRVGRGLGALEWIELATGRRTASGPALTALARHLRVLA
jgi:hypothetical protein